MTPDPIMAHLEAAFALMVRHSPIPNQPLDTGHKGSPCLTTYPLRPSVSSDLSNVSRPLTSAQVDDTPGLRGFSPNEDDA